MAQCHKLNYDKRSKAAALEVGDTVLVCVTSFKGHHKIQNQRKNRGYVVERHPYPNVPVCVVCPKDGEGHSQTLHRNYLLLISPKLEQTEKDAPMAEIEYTSTSAPVPPVGSKPADAEPSGMAISDTTGSMSLRVVHTNLLHSDGDKCNPEPTSTEVLELCVIGRYQPAQYLGCVCWSVYLSPFDIMSVHHSCGKYSVSTLHLCHPMSARHHSL